MNVFKQFWSKLADIQKDANTELVRDLEHELFELNKKLIDACDSVEIRKLLEAIHNKEIEISRFKKSYIQKDTKDLVQARMHDLMPLIAEAKEKLNRAISNKDNEARLSIEADLRTLNSEYHKLEDEMNKTYLSKSQNDVIEKAITEKQNNPWAICTAAVGRDSSKYETCVLDVKRKLGIHKDISESDYEMNVLDKDVNEYKDTEVINVKDLKIGDITTRHGKVKNVKAESNGEWTVETQSGLLKFGSSFSQIAIKKSTNKAVDVSFAGKEPKSLLAEQDLEGTETTKDMKEYEVSITWQGDAQAKTKTMTIKANSSQEAIDAGRNKVMDEEGRGTFGPYNHIIRENAVETKRSVIKQIADSFITKLEKSHSQDKLDDMIEDEKNGEAEYREAADKTSDMEVAEQFNEMADDEDKHKRMLEGMKKEEGSWKIVNTLKYNGHEITTERNGNLYAYTVDGGGQSFQTLEAAKKEVDSMKKDQDTYEYRTIVVRKVNGKMEFTIAGKKYVVRDMSDAMDKIDSLLSKEMKEASESINDAVKSIELKKYGAEEYQRDVERFVESENSKNTPKDVVARLLRQKFNLTDADIAIELDGYTVKSMEETEETKKELYVFKTNWKDNFLGRYNATICENNGMYYAQVIETIENRPYLAQFYPTLQEAKAAIENCKRETVMKKSFASYWKSKVNKSMSISEKNMLMTEVIERSEGDVNWMTNSRKYLHDKGASEAEIAEIMNAIIEKIKKY